MEGKKMKVTIKEKTWSKDRLAGTFSRLMVSMFVLIFAILLGWTPQSVSAQDKALFVLDWAPYAAHTGYWNALEGGFFKKAGIDAKIIRGYGSADTIKRIAAKNGDFGFADTGTLVVARSKGAKVKSLGVLHNNESHSVYVLKSSGIRSIKELSGKHYGDSQGGSTAALFPALATLHGVKNWKFTHLAPTAKNPALLGKKVDFEARRQKDGRRVDRIPVVRFRPQVSWKRHRGAR
jgi:NitT/TauT family transport system substrate-binding protein